MTALLWGGAAFLVVVLAGAGLLGLILVVSLAGKPRTPKPIEVASEGSYGVALIRAADAAGLFGAGAQIERRLGDHKAQVTIQNLIDAFTAGPAPISAPALAPSRAASSRSG